MQTQRSIRGAIWVEANLPDLQDGSQQLHRTLLAFYLSQWEDFQIYGGGEETDARDASGQEIQQRHERRCENGLSDLWQGFQICGNARSHKEEPWADDYGLQGEIWKACALGRNLSSVRPLRPRNNPRQ